MSAAGRMSNTSRAICSSFSSAISPVPNVSTITDIGCATPIAYATCASHRFAIPAATMLFAICRTAYAGRAVDLCRVLARERAATVAGHAAVGVDDDLAAGEPAVGVRTAELEDAGRVDEDLEVVVGELRRQRRPDDVLDERGPDLTVDADAGIVLRGDDHVHQPLRDAVFVLDAHLGLAVGPQEVDEHPGGGPLRGARPTGARARSASA